MGHIEAVNADFTKECFRANVNPLQKWGTHNESRWAKQGTGFSVVVVSGEPKSHQIEVTKNNMTQHLCREGNSWKMFGPMRHKGQWGRTAKWHLTDVTEIHSHCINNAVLVTRQLNCLEKYIYQLHWGHIFGRNPEVSTVCRTHWAFFFLNHIILF